MKTIVYGFFKRLVFCKPLVFKIQTIHRTNRCHHVFNYRYSETDKYGQACRITSERKELVIDENLEELERTMSES
jgi:hypothetical protein